MEWCVGKPESPWLSQRARTKKGAEKRIGVFLTVNVTN